MAVRLARSMGIRRRRGGYRGSLDPIDRDDLDDSCGEGIDFWRLGGGAGGSCRANRGLGEARDGLEPSGAVAGVGGRHAWRVSAG